MAITIKPNIDTKLAPSSLEFTKNNNGDIISVKLKIDKPSNMNSNNHRLKVIVKYGFGEVIKEFFGELKGNNIEFDLSSIKSSLVSFCGYQLYFFYVTMDAKGEEVEEKGPYTISNLYLIPNSGNANLTVNNETATFTYEN
jgi:hypothetical protein